jgi:hypothetical protein
MIHTSLDRQAGLGDIQDTRGTPPAEFNRNPDDGQGISRPLLGVALQPTLIGKGYTVTIKKTAVTSGSFTGGCPRLAINKPTHLKPDTGNTETQLLC